MSIEQLTDDERASLMLGQAMRRAMIETDHFSAELRTQAWALYSAILKHGLSQDEAQFITMTTRLLDFSEQWAEHLVETAKIHERAIKKGRRKK